MRFKDRFFDTKTTTGWPDAMINYRLLSAAPELKTHNHICEVQIVHKKLLMCRDRDGLGGHDGYARERNAREFLEYLGEEVPTSWQAHAGITGKLAVKLSKGAMSSNKRLISERDEAVEAEKTAESRREEAVAAHKFAESRREDTVAAHKFAESRTELGIWTVARNKEKLMAWRGRLSGRTASRTAKVQDANKESGATAPIQAADDMDIEDLDSRQKERKHAAH